MSLPMNLAMRKAKERRMMNVAKSRKITETAFPNAQIQRCIIHKIRSSTRFVSYKHIKEPMTDLKKVYQAISEEGSYEQPDFVQG